MENQYTPHLLLTDEEIKELICKLNVDIYELKKIYYEKILYMEEDLYLLKRHFCPEKFQQLNVSSHQILGLCDAPLTTED